MRLTLFPHHRPVSNPLVQVRSSISIFKAAQHITCLNIILRYTIVSSKITFWLTDYQNPSFWTYSLISPSNLNNFVTLQHVVVTSPCLQTMHDILAKKQEKTCPKLQLAFTCSFPHVIIIQMSSHLTNSWFSCPFPCLSGI